jgi:hypothetical protein
MSKSKQHGKRANAGAVASQLKCAKKDLDIERHFIDDFMTRQCEFSQSLGSGWVLIRHHSGDATSGQYLRELENESLKS